MRKVGDEVFFTSKFPVRMDLKALNIKDISEIDVVLVSTFKDCYGLPYLIQSNQFKGKIYMTQAMAQIGRALLIEFVKMCEERNSNSIQFSSQAAQSFGSMSLTDNDNQSKYNQGASQDWIEQD